MSQKLSDSHAMLDCLLDGKALPDHLARSKAGVILPKARTQGQTDAELARAFNDAIAKEVAAKMNLQPLIAINHIHKCKCGNTWQAFGFYARRVKQAISGEAAATFTKRLDYDPRPETPSEVEWLEVLEQTCLSCYGGPKAADYLTSQNRIGGVTGLRALTLQVADSLNRRGSQQ